MLHFADGSDIAAPANLADAALMRSIGRWASTAVKACRRRERTKPRDPRSRAQIRWTGGFGTFHEDNAMLTGFAKGITAGFPAEGKDDIEKRAAGTDDPQAGAAPANGPS